DSAAALFGELRREALERRWLPEAALATLALARLDAEGGRGPESESAAELEAAFGAAGAEGLANVLAALRDVPASLPPGESPWDFTVALAASLLRLLRPRGERSAPLPFG